MSNSDSFIDEVSEEVRRDRLYAAMKRYGWIAVLGVLLLVGGAAWREWSRAGAEAEAQAFGDAVLAALDTEDASERADALENIEPPSADAAAVRALLLASERKEAGSDTDAAAALTAIGTDGETDQIYRQIASYKALSGGALSPDERRIALEALAQPGNPLRLLAEEQLALLEVESGETEAAITRLQAILSDSEVDRGLRRRAAQLIVALGGDLEPA
ncbi:tetratricopeptide repeat protein [Litorisediminicola beolgyonensis]|uniref:Tetratricopeptide repeat protein n=1 Tax=Litorisediminicola beolgyonensis TaxID=1173614 RepID=A0ABW3ZHE4_9RHOB